VSLTLSVFADKQHEEKPRKSKRLIDYQQKEIKIEPFDEARPCWRALFLLREYLFAEIFLDLFPFLVFRTHL
jgi:hypothetical protein